MSGFYTGLVDHRGQPIKKAELLVEQAEASTRGVRQPYGDHPASGLTPGRLASILRESITGSPISMLELAEDMEERFPHYQSVVATRKMQVAGLEVSVQPASDDAHDIDMAAECLDIVERDEFQDESFDILDATSKSFSATEISWETSASQWNPQKLTYRLPTWFTFDNDNTIMLRGDEGDEYLKPFSWIVHKGKAKSGLTIRGGLARMAAWPFFFHAFTGKDWAIFCEAYGQPLRVGKYGSGASQNDKDTLLRAVTEIGADYAAIIPESMVIDFIKADLSGSHELYEKRSEFLERQISKLVLGQVGTTDAVAGGFAGNKIHNEVREDIEKDDARRLSATINRDLIIPFVLLNHGPQKKYPKFKIGRPDKEDVKALVENVVKLVPLGLPVSVSDMLGRVGLPDPKKGETLLAVSGRAAPAAEAEPASEPEKTTKAAAVLPAQKHEDSISASIDDLLADSGWEELVAPIVDGLAEELAEATSEAEAKAILQRYAEKLHPEELATTLAQMTFAARLSGEVEEDIS